MIFDDDDEIDLDEEIEETVVCPECGSEDLENIGEDDAGNVWFECSDCGERFTEGEEEE